MLNVKLSHLSKTTVEYLPLSIVHLNMTVLWHSLSSILVLEDICPGLLHQIGVSKSSIYLIVLLNFLANIMLFLIRLFIYLYS